MLIQICDICGKTVTHLQPGPPELEPIEQCDECFHDLLRRFSLVEQRVAETKLQLRVEVITEWQRERGRKEPGA
jgi:hypothetical protein